MYAWAVKHREDDARILETISGMIGPAQVAGLFMQLNDFVALPPWSWI